MTREEVLGILRAHEPELKAAGLLHLRLFGSVARGEAGAESDVDLLYDLDPANSYSLLDLSRLQYQLTDMVGRNVDLASESLLKPRIRQHILQEAVVAF